MCNVEEKKLLIVQNKEDIKMKSLLDPVGRDDLNLAPKHPNEIVVSDRSIFSRIINPEKELAKLEAEIKLYEKGIKFPEEITHVNIEYLKNADPSINPYPVLEGEELDEMENSLKKYGQIFPFLVVKHDETRYTLLNGNTRTALMRYMYIESGKNVFKTAKCFVINSSDISQLEMVDIILACNISRKCNTETMTRVYMMRIEIEKVRKVKKNEMDIHRKVASDMGVSVSTVYNYRTLSNCSEKTMFLLDRGYINSSSARRLAKLSKEVQDAVIDEFGVNNIRDDYMKYIKPWHSLMSVKNTVALIKSWKYPVHTVLKITGRRNDVLALKDEIDKICANNKNYNQLKLRLLKTDFKFNCGHKCDETYAKRVPECYKHLLDLGPHPQRDIIKKKRRKKE